MQTVKINDKIQFRAPSELKPDKKNARTHSPEQLEQIARSITEFGFVNPILIDEKCSIMAGHGRYAAGLRLGLTEMPTIQISHLNATQKRALMIADNRIALNAGWDQDILQKELMDLLGEGVNLQILGLDEGEIHELNTLAESTSRDLAQLMHHQGNVMDPSGSPQSPSHQQSDTLSNTSGIAQADSINNFLQNDIRFIQLHYPIQVHERVVRMLAQAAQDNGVDNNSDAVLKILEEIYG